MKIYRFHESHKTKEEKKKEEIQLLKDLLEENPVNDTHDFYVFAATDKFEEAENGMYKKTLDIENMCRVTGDEEGYSSMKGINLRAMFQDNTKAYHIWLPKDVRSMVEGNGTQNLPSWLNDLIAKNKQHGIDEHGTQVTKDVKNRRKDMGKYNL